MNAKKPIGLVIVCLIAICLASGAASAQEVTDPNQAPYTKTIQSLGNGYGITRITTVNSSANPSYAFNSLDGGAITTPCRS